MTPRLLAGVAVLAALAACSKDGLTPRSPQLQITVVEQPHYTAFSDAAPPSIELGAVPLFSSSTAVFLLSNPTDVPLDVSRLELVDTAGESWRAELSVSDDRVPAFGAVELRVVYAPTAEQQADGTTVRVHSNATNGREQDVHVSGTGLFAGAPDIELGYPGYTGPLAADCNDTDADGATDRCIVPDAGALRFGNIGLGEQGTVEITIRNRAACSPRPGIDACDSCALVLSRNPAAYDLGVGFKPGSNAGGLFSVVGADTLPVTVRQRDLTCDEQGDLRLLLAFAAPLVEGQHTAVLVIESNDPDEAVIEIPVHAWAREAPIAIAELRAFDPADPSDPYSVAGDIHPLERVYFDGSDSYDPTAPTDPTRLVDYRWEVIETPEGANRDDFAEDGDGTPYFSFWLPLAGTYVVRLTVENVDGIKSGDTEQARVTITAVPGSRLHIQLVWDNANNDQDLHLVRLAQSGGVCGQPADCYWDNMFPQWFSSHVAGDGPNPRLDIDDTSGLGPENINIDDPAAESYRIYVHYYWDDSSSPDTAATRVTVRVFLDGVQAAEYRRTLSQHDVWAVADVTWGAGGGSITPYASDVSGELGTVRSMVDSYDNCSGDGWVFP